MKWHLADIFECAARTKSDALAVIHGNVRRTWRAYEERSARIASALLAAGLRADSKVAIYGYNSVEYLEAQFATFKARAVPVNINYRYLEKELAYILENSDSEAIFFDAQFGPRLATILDRLPLVKLLVEIDDGSGLHLNGAVSFESLISSNDRLPRQDYSEEDIYMLYTGGTTGMPKGVMYRQGEFTSNSIAALLGENAPNDPNHLESLIAHTSNQVISCPACPLMHGTGMWIGVFGAHVQGGTVVTFRNQKLDSAALWKLIEGEKVQVIAIAGDAMARPMLMALNEAKAAGKPYDLRSLKMIYSSGVMFSMEVKHQLLELIDTTIFDALGSTEGGLGKSIITRSSSPATTALFQAYPTTKVFNDQLQEVSPGSDEIGLVASGGMVPIGYYKDPEKSSRTFRVVAGKRYSFPGDFAKVNADGSIALLGRGSMCINTGGEKVFPEEVEEAIKRHDSVWDALVVGVPDERFGEKIAAVVSLRPGQTVDKVALVAYLRLQLADYKLPRRVIVVDSVRRAPNGKADYTWAKEIALHDAA